MSNIKIKDTPCAYRAFQNKQAEPLVEEKPDMVNRPKHYIGKIETIDYIRDKLTPQGFTDYCCGNVLKYISRWRKKDGIQDLKKAQVYLNWMIESAEKEQTVGSAVGSTTNFERKKYMEALKNK